MLFHLVDAEETDDELSPIETYLPLIQMMWLDVVYAFGLDGLLVVDQTDRKVARSLHFEGLDCSRFDSLADAEAANPDARWVYFEQGGQPLTEFVHPEGDVIYAFGPDTVGLAHEPGKTYVEIPTVRPWGFFSPLAAAIVFADRLMRTRTAGALMRQR
ncbi:MAG: hypothetical protein M3N29_03955 [Chloroflexota bacterium]|nr:hypothetical protein [Chloroflexota bacterium]